LNIIKNTTIHQNFQRFQLYRKEKHDTKKDVTITKTPTTYVQYFSTSEENVFVKGKK
jgi:hypothetical protein